MLRGLESADPAIRTWAAYAIAQLLPLDDAVLEGLVSYLDDPSPEIEARMRWVFQAQGTLSPRVTQLRMTAIGPAPQR